MWDDGNLIWCSQNVAQPTEELINSKIQSDDKETDSVSSQEIDKLITNKLTGFVDKSMIQNEIMKEYNATKEQYEQTKVNIDKYKTMLDCCKTPLKEITDYIDIEYKHSISKNKMKKRLSLQLQTIKDCNVNLEEDINTYKTYQEQLFALTKFEKLLVNIQNYTYETINMLMTILNEHKFIEYDNSLIKLTDAGINATQVQEFHSLVSAEIIQKTNYLDKYSVKQLCAFFSCFSNIMVSDEDKYHYTSLEDPELKSLVGDLENLYNKYFDIETSYQLDTGCEYHLCFDILVYVMEWCDADSERQCKIILQKLAEKNIFLGEFVKALLKINNTANELEKIAEMNNKITLLQKLREIPAKTLKFVATNQSLYV